MIDQIKNIIAENKTKLGLSDFSPEKILVSKFFHGSPTTSAKVLFFVSAGGRPVCLLKMVRNSEDNDLIEREAAGIKYFRSVGLKTPELFFVGEMNGLKYLCQEIVRGKPMGKKSEADIFHFVAKYHNSVAKTRKIKISSVLEKIEALNIKGDEEYNQTISLLQDRKEVDLFASPQHGDLTYKNLMKDSSGIVFIDFENFGLRSVWGIDVTHYLARMFDANNEKRSVAETASYFVQATAKYRKDCNLGISDEECRDLFLMDTLFEVLQKNLFYMKSEVIPVMKNIWSK